MRIIGGNYRGKKIYLPLDKKTRPLRDIVKESIFNLIEHSNNFLMRVIVLMTIAFPSPIMKIIFERIMLNVTSTSL